MNRLYATLIVIACALPALASAGEVFGTITNDAGPVGEGTLVEATFKAGKHGPAKTDKAGKYRLVISETGRCTLAVTRDGNIKLNGIMRKDNSTKYGYVYEDTRRSQ